MGSLKRRARQRFDDKIIKTGDAACTIDGSSEVLLNVWNDVTRNEAIGAWDHFCGSDVICH
jgi:hypothetical protein